MPSVEVAAGTIEYEDTGGTGPVLLFVHGLLMNSPVWRGVVTELAPEFRCISPTLPLGGHRQPMRPGADLSVEGLALMIDEFAERLGLRDATLIQNDWGGAQILIAHERASRFTSLVLTSCEAFDNYPPAIARPLVLLARVPGGLWALMQVLRFRVARRFPTAWGAMSKRPIPKSVMDDWFRPATTNTEIRRDLAAFATSVPDRATVTSWSEACSGYLDPVLIVWARADKVMPIDHGRRLATVFPDATLVELDDSYTIIPEDRPVELARAIRSFLVELGARRERTKPRT